MYCLPVDFVLSYVGEADSSDFPFFCTVGSVEAILIFHGCADNSTVRKEELSLSMPGRYVGGGEVKFHSFLTSGVDGCDLQTSCPCRFAPWERSPVPLHRRLLGSHNMSGRI